VKVRSFLGTAPSLGTPHADVLMVRPSVSPELIGDRGYVHARHQSLAA
jgi:hypothetical protein